MTYLAFDGLRYWWVPYPYPVQNIDRLALEQLYRNRGLIV